MRQVRAWAIALVATLLLFPASAQLMLPAALRQPPPVKCEWSTLGAARQGEVAGRRALSVSPSPTTQVWMVRGGNRLSLAASGVHVGDKLSVSISAKVSGSNSAFSGVCKLRHLYGATAQRMLVAHAPLGSLDVIWRVEIRASRPAGQDRPPPTLSAWDVSLGRGEAISKEIPLDGMICLDDIPEMRQERPASHRFGGRTRLDVNAEQTTYKLSERQQTVLVNSILNAVSLWVRACIACKVEHLVVVNMDSRAYTRPAVNTWVESVARERPAVGAGTSPTAEQDKALAHALQPVQMLMAGEPPSNPPTGKLLERYAELPDTSKDLLCSLHTSKETTPTADAVRRAACAGSAERREAARIRVRFRDGPTSCGNDSNVIACRSDNELTEYNARDYRFVTQTIGQEAIGTGAVDVDLDHVIAHEMGHWVGLDHIDSGQSLMASSMENSRCIDMRTVNRLAAQHDGAGGSKRRQAFTMNRARPGH